MSAVVSLNAPYAQFRADLEIQNTGRTFRVLKREANRSNP
jgi:hypothetical protein